MSDDLYVEWIQTQTQQEKAYEIRKLEFLNFFYTHSLLKTVMNDCTLLNTSLLAVDYYHRHLFYVFFEVKHSTFC